MIIDRNTSEAHREIDARREIEALSATVSRLAEHLEHRDRQLEAIRRTSDALFSHPDVDSMIEATLHVALEVLRADAGTVFLHDPATDTLVFRYVVGEARGKLQGTSIPSGQGVAGTVFRSGQPVLVGDVTARRDFNPEVDRKTGYHTTSMMTVPVRRTGSNPIGVMQVLNAKVPFTLHDLEVLQVLCGQAATGLEHAQLVESQRNAEIGNRVGEIAHDIKNMMTPIETGVMTLQPLLAEVVADGQVSHHAVAELAAVHPWLLDDVLAAAQRVRRRTEAIAAMVKGNLPPPVFEMGRIDSVVDDVSKTLARTAESKNVQLVHEHATDIPEFRFDHDRLYDCLYNLVNNALPETPEGGRVAIRTRYTETNDEIVVQVEDTGRGMPEPVRRRLFTAEAVSTKPGGTGLGTSVAARIVREHGGTIFVESEVGRGTRVTIVLPRLRPDQSLPESA